MISRRVVTLLFFLTMTTLAATPEEGMLSTLHAHDPLSHTLCFGDGGYGTTVQENEVKNRCSDIDFDHLVPGSFSVGVEGARIAAILDLGTEDELAAKYGFEQTVA